MEVVEVEVEIKAGVEVGARVEVAFSCNNDLAWDCLNNSNNNNNNSNNDNNNSNKSYEYE